jgi:hypothetical protein
VEGSAFSNLPMALATVFDMGRSTLPGFFCG